MIPIALILLLAQAGAAFTGVPVRGVMGGVPGRVSCAGDPQLSVLRLAGGAMGTAPAVLGAMAALPVGAAAVVVWLLQHMHMSVGMHAPTEKQLEEEDTEQHALFRHVPELKQRLAWRQLGNFPTPVHRGRCKAARAAGCGDAPQTVSFYVKREDLSSEFYGGNKVRTLQHQLAVIEARLEHEGGGGERDIVVFGSGGSNQVVATLVHADRLSLPANLSALWIADPPDLDNALNMLSALSLRMRAYTTWGSPVSLATALLRAVLRGSFLLPLGGNNPSGVLGQVSGALELGEQIESGHLPDVDGIYVPVGSSCTISGLIIGVALARRLGLKAFSRPGFRLHLVPIHHVFAALNRAVGFYTAPFTRYVPLTVRHSIHATCTQLTSLGGPDVLSEALAVLTHEVRVHDHADLTGKYGAHSDVSRAAACSFDQTGVLLDGEGGEAPGLWLCGHFTAKAFAAMCNDLRAPEATPGKTMLLWQTKSVVQPRGGQDEWRKMLRMPAAVRAWAQQGTAASQVRPGKVDLERGSPDDYRALMTEIATAET